MSWDSNLSPPSGKGSKFFSKIGICWNAVDGSFWTGEKKKPTAWVYKNLVNGIFTTKLNDGELNHQAVNGKTQEFTKLRGSAMPGVPRSSSLEVWETDIPQGTDGGTALREANG